MEVTIYLLKANILSLYKRNLSQNHSLKEFMEQKNISIRLSAIVYGLVMLALEKYVPCLLFMNELWLLEICG